MVDATSFFNYSFDGTDSKLTIIGDAGTTGLLIPYQLGVTLVEPTIFKSSFFELDSFTVDWISQSTICPSPSNYFVLA